MDDSVAGERSGGRTDGRAGGRTDERTGGRAGERTDERVSGGGNSSRRSDPQEQEWIRRCRNGNRAAYEPLVRRYARWAEAFAFRRVGHRDEARDLAQEAFVRAFHAMPRFRPGRPFLPWFLTILDNLCRSYRRGLRAEPGLEEIAPPSTDGGMERVRQRLDLERGLSGLPEAQRQVVVLKEIRGFAHREVADRLEIPVGTAMSRLHTALRRLRKVLGRGAETEDRRPRRDGGEARFPAAPVKREAGGGSA